MHAQLGTVEELPEDFRHAMEQARVTALWPAMRDVLPRDNPHGPTLPGHWAYGRIRPLLLRAGSLTPVEKAERRVLVLGDPGRGDGALQATSTIYLGLQLLLPGELAPVHKHTPSAARIVVEGDGAAYTTVNGEKCPMEPGDLILTPGGQWHEHGHQGREPVIWLDVLDLPLFIYLEGSYSVEGEPQTTGKRPDASQVEYTAAGLRPPRRYGQPQKAYPLLRYPWGHVQAALLRMEKHAGPEDAIELVYVNPENGEPCLPTLGFTAMLLRPSVQYRPPRRSTSTVFHVIEGEGTSSINDKSIAWRRGDTFSAPVFATIRHRATIERPAYLMRIDDAPLQTALRYYEERDAS
jgi:gentisate 1,2-dioxygenase